MEVTKGHIELRVFLSIFDQTLTAHFLKTDDARTNRVLLLEQLTPKVHDDSISDDNAPSSGSNELIKFKLQTLSTFATVIRFSWQYHHSTGNWTGFQKRVLILEFFCQKNGFSEKLSLENVEPKFSTLECDVLEPNRFDFWNQHNRISLETNFQENKKTLHERVYYVFGKIVIKCRFETKYRFLKKNLRKNPT